jgi:RhoGAP domain.
MSENRTRDLDTKESALYHTVVFTGSMSEGIYRRSGSTTNVSKLLAEFRQDAWQVQLSREQYTEHDVSTVLKRFFRDLPEPLLSTELHVHLCNAAGKYTCTSV